jgi:hypothetical protein
MTHNIKLNNYSFLLGFETTELYLCRTAVGRRRWPHVGEVRAIFVIWKLDCSCDMGNFVK